MQIRQISWFLILLLSHVLGDYYFQSSKLAGQKEKSFRKVILHAAIDMLKYYLDQRRKLPIRHIFVFPLGAFCLTDWETGKYFIY